MKYFRQTESLDDLKAQYRALLKKIDYKNPRHMAILKKVDEEYSKCEKYIKLAPMRKLKEEFVKKSEQREQERRREELERDMYYEEMRNRTKRTYTKEECEMYFREANRALKNYAYNQVKDMPYDSMCQSHIRRFRTQGYRNAYIFIRTVCECDTDGCYRKMKIAGDNLECAIVAITSKANKEKTLEQLEEKLGKIYVDAYMEACEKYLDSVDYARLLVSDEKEKKFEKNDEKVQKFSIGFSRIFGSLLVGGFFGVISLVLCIGMSDLVESKEMMPFVEMATIIIVIIAVIISVGLFNAFLTSIKRKDPSPKNVSLSRVTEHEDYNDMLKWENRGRTGVAFIRLFGKLFGIRM